MRTIVVSGEGGQGVKTIAGTLARILMKLGYEVAVLNDYDSPVRGSMSVAYLSYDDRPIANPVVDRADILLKLSDKAAGLSGVKVVGEPGLGAEEETDFYQLGVDNFGREIFGNMIALGRLLKLLGIGLHQIDAEEALPPRYRAENLAAIRFGYELDAGARARGGAPSPGG